MDIVKVCFFKKSPFGVNELYELNLIEGKETIMTNKGCDIKESSTEKLKYKAIKLYEIIRQWDEKYVNKNVIDGMEYHFLVEFVNGDLIKVYCKNKLPKGYDEFKRVVEEN